MSAARVKEPPTIRLSPPSDRDIAQFIGEQSRLEFGYPFVGGTLADPPQPPSGFVVDHNRRRIGQGSEDFERAKAALRAWKMFDLGWTRILPACAPISAGTTVAVLARVMGLWWLNACRIVCVIDEPARFGFAYGTLPGHAERGEERFTVERLPDGSVWYEILAFSCPKHPLARIANPLARVYQRRFARDSLAAMAAASAPDAP